MVKQELIDRSPVRFFEKALNGGMKSGEVGVVASKKGVGKTAVLVQIGIDQLLQGKQVVHVSFNQPTSYVMTWYENIFVEMAKKKNLDKSDAVREEIIRNRVVLNFNQDTVSASQIISTIKALSQGGIATQCLIIDGLDFSRLTVADFTQMKTFAKEANLIIWYSCDTEKTELKGIFPADIEKHFDVIIYFDARSDATQLRLLKVRNELINNLSVKLDNKTLLIMNK